MTKNLTAAQIKGYKRRAFIEKVNNLKTNTQQQKMKYYAASLLAVASYALKLKQDDCPDIPEGASVEAVFNLVDTDGSGAIDSAEGEKGLKCAVSKGIMTKAEAEEVAGKLEKAAGADKLLSLDELKAAIPDDDALAQESSGTSGPDDDLAE